MNRAKPPATMIKRLSIFAFGMGCYALFNLTYLYFAGFLANLGVAKGIDSGEGVSLGEAAVINGLLLTIFALQHSLMARSGFKRQWTRIIPESAERSAYLLGSSLALLLLFWQWRPMPGTIWRLENTAAGTVMTAFFWAGWALIVLSTFLVNHFDLFGLRQVYLQLRGREYREIEFQTPALYRLVRHPIMLGMLITFWAAPHMSTGHLFFALGMTIYILIGLHFEEQDLLRQLGPTYAEYRQRVPMLLPIQRKWWSSK